MQVHGIQNIDDNSVLKRITCSTCGHASLDKVPHGTICSSVRRVSRGADDLGHVGRRFALKLTQESQWRDRLLMRVYGHLPRATSVFADVF